MIFEWDENKNKANQKIHGISFEEATAVFDDEYLVENFNFKHSTDAESRYTCIGFLEKRLIVIVIVYTERKENLRLISARQANKEERRTYYERLRKAYSRS